jgi:hypothetical protein
VPRKLTVLLATLALLLPGVAIGCGDDDGGGGNGLSTQDNLKVDQDRADIEEFCTVSVAGKGDLYDRAFFAMVGAVDQLVILYKENSGETYHEALKDRDIKMNQVVQEAAKKLNGCGKDGKQQAAKLTQALEG